ncbi:hypothetical protein ACFPPD_06785 [Cohnella suwonensis]|uniref:Uncharacterized protein n=1 Tax=Cohnella suwonensis TaxID=696072 RepID=A0ABW0LR91_9BACL
MPEDFYFAYGYDGKTATRLYRFVGGNFERYDPSDKSWTPDPGQSRIFIGEDLEYDEITEEQAKQIAVLV